MLAVVVFLGLRKVGLGILHELRLSSLISEAIRLAIDRRTDGAIRGYVGAENEALRTHVIELAGRGHGGRRQSKQQGCSDCRLYENTRHDDLQGGGGSFPNPFDNAQGLIVCCVERMRGTAEGQRGCSATQNTLRETSL